MKCYRPFVFNDLYLPCGKCDACLANKKLVKLSRVHRVVSRGVFFTLTYDNDSVPFVVPNCHLVFRLCGDVYLPDDWQGKRDNIAMDWPNTLQLVLFKKDITLFIKRLRKAIYEEFKQSYSASDLRLQYFICGEYSPLPKARPHFHGLLFCDCSALYFEKHYSFRWLRWKAPLFAKYIYEAWPYCSQHRITRYTTEIMSGAAADYCTKYIGKSFGNAGLFRPFSKCSQNLGFSDNFIRRFLLLFFRHFGKVRFFSLDPLWIEFNTPSNLNRFLCKPYGLVRNGVDATYSRIKNLVGKKCKECEHLADFNFLRCYRLFVSYTDLQISIYHFLTLMFNFYVDKAFCTLSRFYNDYDPINYDITWDWLYNMDTEKSFPLLCRYTHRIGISIATFMAFKPRYEQKYGSYLSEVLSFNEQKLYPFEK